MVQVINLSTWAELLEAFLDVADEVVVMLTRHRGNICESFGANIDHAAEVDNILLATLGPQFPDTGTGSSIVVMSQRSIDWSAQWL